MAILKHSERLIVQPSLLRLLKIDTASLKLLNPFSFIISKTVSITVSCSHWDIMLLSLILAR